MAKREQEGITMHPCVSRVVFSRTESKCKFQVQNVNTIPGVHKQHRGDNIRSQNQQYARTLWRRIIIIILQMRSPSYTVLSLSLQASLPFWGIDRAPVSGLHVTLGGEIYENRNENVWHYGKRRPFLLLLFRERTTRAARKVRTLYRKRWRLYGIRPIQISEWTFYWLEN